MTLPVGGLALTESMSGQTLIVPFTRMLPVFGGTWQSIVTDTVVVACAATLNAAEVPVQVVWLSVEVPVSVRLYPEPTATLPMTALTVEEPATLMFPE